MDIHAVRKARWANLAAVFVVSLLLTLLWQWRGNAYRSEWSGDPDEPAHYVTGLMVHDYIAGRLPGPPMAYAQRYYDFYPKVAMGHWPPGFYMIQAAWTLVFTPSRVSLLLLMAAIGAAWLTASYAWIALYFPAWMAWATVLFLSATWDFQSSSRMVMAEIVVALFTLFALRFLARYLDSSKGDWWDGVWFSVASLATVLIKGTGVALAPMSFLGALFGRRWSILRSASFWVPPLLVAILAAGWFLTAPGALHEKVVPLAGLGRFHWTRIPGSLDHWLQALGWAGGGFAAVGFVRKFWAIAAGTEARAVWIVTVLFLPVTLACRALFAPWEVKHLVTTLPLLMLCLWDGLDWVLAKFPWRRAGLALACAALTATAIRSVATMPQKVHLGLDRVAIDLLASPEYAHDRFLIISDGTGEGVFIAETAAHEKRPGHIVERASKVLAEESFMGDHVRLLYDSPEELMRFFEKTPNRIVIVDGVESNAPFMNLVRETIHQYPDKWRSLASYPRGGARLPIQVLRIR
jgi:hypothetical protein